MVIRRLVVQVFFGNTLSTIKNLIFLGYFSLKKPPGIEMPGGLLHMRKFLSLLLSTACQNAMPMIYSLLGGALSIHSSFLIQELSAFDTVPF